MDTKFIVFTRGRTGSSVIIDELNNLSSIVAAHELFIKRDFSEIENILDELYPVVLPYYLWKIHGSLLRRINMLFTSEKHILARYLDEAVNIAAKKGVSVFGFKALSHHFLQTPGLFPTLLQQQYRVIYLTRNIPRQVISGMVAKLRGKYNNRGSYQDDRRYDIDIEEFKYLLQWEEKAIIEDLDLLKHNKLRFIVVTYEDYINRREAFFKNILNFLNVPVELPEPSSYSIMIKDLKYTVENYDAVIDCVQKLGMRIE